ncbi:hypothetical protein Ferp_1621 [Ferroglobus placidus DSM 10642]|uniref:Uncharacterized protein n=1 Tax=Ferroglobus placidus (strain DSM 10642 / AEDII12DO) TaxID=589924 RepID=D3RZ57_FERPA|nr:hypothetical protein [Ferroglobus placidus]ADC65770.1 hypothetical protein Ferp_1621 [Ferroglobus placidus DSM 10642]
MRGEKGGSASVHLLAENPEIICRVCQFYKPGKEVLECGAFKILKFFVESGRLSVEEIEEAAKVVEKTSSEEV